MFLKEFRIKRKYNKVVQILGSNNMFKRCKSIKAMSTAGKTQEAERMLNKVRVEFGSALSAAKVTKDEFVFMMEHFDNWGKNS